MWGGLSGAQSVCYLQIHLECGVGYQENKVYVYLHIQLECGVGYQEHKVYVYLQIQLECGVGYQEHNEHCHTCPHNTMLLYTPAININTSNI